MRHQIRLLICSYLLGWAYEITPNGTKQKEDLADFILEKLPTWD